MLLQYIGKAFVNMALYGILLMIFSWKKNTLELEIISKNHENSPQISNLYENLKIPLV